MIDEVRPLLEEEGPIAGSTVRSRVLDWRSEGQRVRLAMKSTALSSLSAANCLTT